MESKALKKYIETVIADACLAEGHPNDVSFGAFVINQKTLALFLHSKYARVTRRIARQVAKNIGRFGVNLGFLSGNGVNWDRDYPHVKNMYSLSNYRALPFYIVGRLSEKGESWLVSVNAPSLPWSMVPKSLPVIKAHGIDQAMELMEAQFEAAGGQMVYGPEDYETYLRDFKKAFGELPAAVEIKEL